MICFTGKNIKMNKHKQNFAGFTLIELLVVIVIVGILATISVATFQGYFARARDARKRANIETISKIIMNNVVANEATSHLIRTCDLSGQNITYAAGPYHSEGDPVPDNQHVACLVKFLKEQGVSFPPPEEDCYILFRESLNPDKFLVTSASDFVAGNIFFDGSSEAKFYIEKDGGDPKGNNYHSIQIYLKEFIKRNCREFGLSGLHVYKKAPYGSGNAGEYIRMIVEPLDPKYFE